MFYFFVKLMCSEMLYIFCGAQCKISNFKLHCTCELSIKIIYKTCYRKFRNGDHSVFLSERNSIRNCSN